ncbi:LacI family DNA-binding transcriptional regulator [Phnomibacter sp. MR]|uniref:LacI family DNA-binding transcriptional regulator n=1 Tax=Phnomibacter sp. MR TaxID=3042318 RepID=UPI003A81226B
MIKGKEVTIYDLARQLNISIATVSRALNDDPVVSKKTKKRIFELAKELGYRHNTFASNLRKQSTHTIGVMVHELNSNFITSVLAGIESVTTEAGYDLIIAHSSESFTKEQSNAQNLFHKRVDGLISSLSFDTTNLEHFKPFEEKKIPVVFFDRVEENSDTIKVIIDNYRCGYMATQHLIEQGCKRIAMVTASLKRNVYAQRHKGFVDAHYDNKLPLDNKLVLIKDLSEQSALECALEILRMKPRPDGLFITNDFVAALCMQALKENGLRIPEDIAVVGFNNDAISRVVEPHLTTIDYPGWDMGVIAARNLISHLKGLADIKQTSTIIVRSELIIRDSSTRKK